MKHTEQFLIKDAYSDGRYPGFEQARKEVLRKLRFELDTDVFPMLDVSDTLNITSVGEPIGVLSLSNHGWDVIIDLAAEFEFLLWLNDGEDAPFREVVGFANQYGGQAEVLDVELYDYDCHVVIVYPHNQPERVVQHLAEVEALKAAKKLAKGDSDETS